MKIMIFAAAVAAATTVASAQEFKQHDLDGGVSIALSSGWSHKQIENPAMKMKAMRDAMEGASETRIKRGDTGILVSYMHFKSDKPAAAMDEQQLASVGEITKMSGRQYLRQSIETEVTPRSEIVGPLGVSLATLTARDGEAFNVAPGHNGGCVTTGSIRRGSAAWAISIASKSCESATHKEAVAAFYAAQNR